MGIAKVDMSWIIPPGPQRVAAFEGGLPDRPPLYSSVNGNNSIGEGGDSLGEM